MIYIVNHSAYEFSFLPEKEYREFYFSMMTGTSINHRWHKDDKIEAKVISEELYEKIKKMRFRLPSLMAYNQIY